MLHATGADSQARRLNENRPLPRTSTPARRSSGFDRHVPESQLHEQPHRLNAGGGLEQLSPAAPPCYATHAPPCYASAPHSPQHTAPMLHLRLTAAARYEPAFGPGRAASYRTWPTHLPQMTGLQLASTRRIHAHAHRAPRWSSSLRSDPVLPRVRVRTFTPPHPTAHTTSSPRRSTAACVWQAACRVGEERGGGARRCGSARRARPLRPLQC